MNKTLSLIKEVLIQVWLSFASIAFSISFIGIIFNPSYWDRDDVYLIALLFTLFLLPSIILRTIFISLKKDKQGFRLYFLINILVISFFLVMEYINRDSEGAGYFSVAAIVLGLLIIPCYLLQKYLIDQRKWLINISIMGLIYILLYSLVIFNGIVYVKVYLKESLEKIGISTNLPPEEHTSIYAEKIMNMLLTEENAKKIDMYITRDEKAGASLYEGEGRGKYLSYKKWLGRGHLSVEINRPDGIKLRHKIEIGTDMRNWKLIRKESNYPIEKPFKRTYLLVQSGIRMVGVTYYEGVKVEFYIDGLVDDVNIKKLEQVVWDISNRIEDIYDKHIKYIAEGPLFKDDPILTRPDLPDPDLELIQTQTSYLMLIQNHQYF